MTDLLNSVAVAALATFSVMQVVINRRLRHRVEVLEVKVAYLDQAGRRKP
jgi:hypothetical protein